MTNIPDFGKKKGTHTDQYNPKAVYENLNKLPLMVQEYRSGMMRKLKEEFSKQLAAAVVEERAYCEKKKIEPKMNKQVYEEILGLMMRCKTLFEMEALARFVFDDNEVPKYEQILDRARCMELVFPVKLKN